jgi:hypothetical protein
VWNRAGRPGGFSLPTDGTGDRDGNGDGSGDDELAHDDLSLLAIWQ